MLVKWWWTLSSIWRKKGKSATFSKVETGTLISEWCSLSRFRGTGALCQLSLWQSVILMMCYSHLKQGCEQGSECECNPLWKRYLSLLKSMAYFAEPEMQSALQYNLSDLPQTSWFGMGICCQSRILLLLLTPQSFVSSSRHAALGCCTLSSLLASLLPHSYHRLVDLIFLQDGEWQPVLLNAVWSSGHANHNMSDSRLVNSFLVLQLPKEINIFITSCNKEAWGDWNWILN